jgi:hypothetical protein
LNGKSLAATPPELGRPIVPPLAVPEKEKKPVEPVAKPKPPAGRLSAGVMVSPDLSSIGLRGRLTPGTNVGVQLEYRLTNRFRVGVGAIHSVKLYSAGVEDYKVPYGFWTYGVAPSGIDANCKVLDLPVHLRFDAVRRARYNVFVSTGLSSYIMLSERYGYHYPTYNPYLRLRTEPGPALLLAGRALPQTAPGRCGLWQGTAGYRRRVCIGEVPDGQDS